MTVMNATPPSSPLSSSPSPTPAPRKSAAAPPPTASTPVRPSPLSKTIPIEDSSTKPPTQAKTRYHISPLTLHRKFCACDAPRREFNNASEVIDYTMTRLDKAWRRMVGTKPHHEIKEAAYRTMVGLREQGYEFAHLVAYEGPKKVEGEKHRDEYSVVFMTPDQDEPSAHRAIAEVMVLVAGKNDPKRGQIENVAVRFATDWEDWTVVQPHEYLRDTSKMRNPHLLVQGDGTIPDEAQIQKILSGIWVQLLKHCTPTAKEFVFRVKRAVEVFHREGKILSQVEIDNVFRVTKNRTNALAAVRMPLYVRPARPKEDVGEVVTKTGEQGVKVLGESTPDENGKGQATKVYKQEEDEEARAGDEIGAVILLDLSQSSPGPPAKVKHMAVVYNGEWPVCHHYRSNIPPPTLKGLEEFVKD